MVRKWGSLHRRSEKRLKLGGMAHNAQMVAATGKSALQTGKVVVEQVEGRDGLLGQSGLSLATECGCSEAEWKQCPRSFSQSTSSQSKEKMCVCGAVRREAIVSPGRAPFTRIQGSKDRQKGWEKVVLLLLTRKVKATAGKVTENRQLLPFLFPVSVNTACCVCAQEASATGYSCIWVQSPYLKKIYCFGCVDGIE